MASCLALHLCSLGFPRGGVTGKRRSPGSVPSAHPLLLQTPGSPSAMTVAAVPPALSAVGFTSSGIAASSLAAKMMSLSAIANGGGVPAGGLVAILQSAGAAGLSMPSTVLVGSAGSAAVASVMNICESIYPFLMGSEVADMATEVADMATEVVDMETGVADMETEVADISTEEALPNLSNTEKD
ncbi:interferon alpha-inducible protein 27-like protein 2B isoform X2 [Mus caroli]|uniref:Interferon alpha-inducible protein 27-like protein 2B isoform X2 n=1 Tax=Mus caroli TaxID=10089 RepID=A0A6P5QMJ8_MUSCR|nr:interferon alpha-inducible protein 27-like protein 2B isoform X2 [Mus caroli]